MARKKITIELVGGIGNQLFGYFAGIYVSHKLGCDFVPYIKKTSRNESNHGSSLNSLNLPHRAVGTKNLSIRLERIARQFSQSILTTSMAQRLGLKDYSRFYVSQSLGSDPNLSRVTSGSYLRGYFQTYKYFEYLQEKGLFPEVTLIKPSEWFHDMATQIRQTKPLIMHVRRGDYLKPENDFIGVLSAEYFVEALSQLRCHKELSTRPVWIFSDDIPRAKHDFKNHDLGPHMWIEQPEASDAAETLILMGLGAGIVTSNSTFSWWAATLGRTNYVVAPSPWFKDHEEPLDLIHPEWIRQKSSWSELS
jgi:hypothetical protein